MIVSLDPDAVLPAYEQLRGQIAGMITLGALEPGTRLPSIRQLASDLGVAPGTVARTYRELAGDGLVRQRRRHGTTVTRPSVSLTDVTARQQLARAARHYAATAGETGHSLDDAVDQLRNAFSELSTG